MWHREPSAHRNRQSVARERGHKYTGSVRTGVGVWFGFWSRWFGRVNATRTTSPRSHCERRTTIPCGPPDGTVGIVTDVVAILDKFTNLTRCATEGTSRSPAEPSRSEVQHHRRGVRDRGVYRESVSVRANRGSVWRVALSEAQHPQHLGRSPQRTFQASRSRQPLVDETRKPPPRVGCQAWNLLP